MKLNDLQLRILGKHCMINREDRDKLTIDILLKWFRQDLGDVRTIYHTIGILNAALIDYLKHLKTLGYE